MPSALEAAGAAREPSEYATLTMDRQPTGLWTQRSPLRDAAVPYLQVKFYGAARFDSLIDGLNREMTARLTAGRRAGSSIWNANTFPALNSFFPFKYIQNNSETIRTIVDGADGVVYDATAGGKTAIFTKGSGAGKARFLGVNGNLFFGDVVEQIEAVPGAGLGAWTTKNWGIVAPTGTTTTKTAAVGADAGDAGNPWTNPSNIASASQYATATVPHGVRTQQPIRNPGCSNNLIATGFSFSAATAPVGIAVQVSGFGNPDVLIVLAQLVYQGAPIGDPRNANLATSPGSITFGGSGDTWGTTLTAAMVNDASFGVEFQVFNFDRANANTVSLQNGTISLILGAIPGATPTGGGSLTTTNGGWQYVYTWGDQPGAHQSTASAASTSTGNFSNMAYVGVTVVASTDPQVNQIRLYRTVDGGASFLEHPNSPFPNTTATLQDSAADNTLNPFSVAPVNHANDPPPIGLTAPCYHMGRVWGIVGSLVYNSGGPDTLNGDGNRAWPPLNFTPLPEQPIRLQAGVTNQGPTLFVYCTSSVYAIFGSGTTGSPFTSAVLYMSGVGILNYDAFDIVGSTPYMLTSKGKLVSLDPSAGYTEQGFPIGDQFTKVTTGGIAAALYNPATAYVTWHEQSSGDTAVYVADGAVGWFRFSPVAAPESGFLWSPRAAIVGGTSAVQSVETAPGFSQLLIGPPVGGGTILFRDATVNADWSGGAYVNFPSWDVKGNIVLCQSGEVAEIAHIGLKSAAVGARPTVSLLLGEIAATAATPFDVLQITGNDPPELPPSTTVYSDRYSALQNGVCPKCDNFQLKVDYGVQNVPDELLMFSVYGCKHSERRQQ